MSSSRIITKKRALLSMIEAPGGFTLLEILIAISILTVGLLGVASMQVSAIRANDIARAQTEAATAGMDCIEKLMRFPYDNLTSGNLTDPPYTIDWNVTDNEPLNNTKTITVTVSWVDHGRAKNVQMNRIVPKVI